MSAVDPELRPLGAGDLDEVLALNQAWVPRVGPVDRDGLVHLVAGSSLALVARTGDGALAGFVIVIPPGADYESPNYRFFAERSDDFRYVDRIAVAPDAQGLGVGRRLYDAVVEHARAGGAARVTCEVNLQPPNPESRAFHARLGFVEVGRQWVYDDRYQVQLLELVLS
jgi:predicted GNAT superfamily acetyltransferase